MRRIRIRRIAVGLVLASILLGAPGIVAADEYEKDRAGHPLRVIAYVVYPLGVIVETLFFRPAYWIVSHEPLQSLFGHEGRD